jgi:hypothetical protein
MNETAIKIGKPAAAFAKANLRAGARESFPAKSGRTKIVDMIPCRARDGDIAAARRLVGGRLRESKDSKPSFPLRSMRTADDVRRATMDVFAALSEDKVTFRASLGALSTSISVLPKISEQQEAEDAAESGRQPRKINES